MNQYTSATLAKSFIERWASRNISNGDAWVLCLWLNSHFTGDADQVAAFLDDEAFPLESRNECKRAIRELECLDPNESALFVEVLTEVMHRLIYATPLRGHLRFLPFIVTPAQVETNPRMMS